MSKTPVSSAQWLRGALVPWYREHQRDLPWRASTSPYEVLLSEAMLQQTRVETVIPYFERFLSRWPTLADLAAAEEDDVLQAWAGLGYYRRARNLLRAARVAHADGGIQPDLVALRALPGVGPYTAGAIASIAFGLPTPAVDGNVERVISRFDGLDEDPKSTPGRRAITARVQQITAPGVASEVTQGLMELGATVCTPRSPRCEVCPWTAGCVARRDGRQSELPVTRPRKKPTPVRAAAGILEREGRVLVGQRRPGLLGRLWEPVGTEMLVDEEPERALVDAFKRRCGVQLHRVTRLGAVQHVFSHRLLTVDVFAVRGEGEVRGDGSYLDLALLDPDDPALALSRLAEKILALRSSAPLLMIAAETDPG